MWTTHGPLDETSMLERLVTVRDLPDNYALEIEWFLRVGIDLSGVPPHLQGGGAAYPGELVRRDAHVILKRNPTEVSALAGGPAKPSPNDVTVGLTGVEMAGEAGGIK